MATFLTWWWERKGGEMRHMDQESTRGDRVLIITSPMMSSARESEHIISARETLDSEWIPAEVAPWIQLRTRSPVRYLATLEHEVGQRDARDLRPDDRERREPAGTRGTELVAVRPSPDIYAIPGGNPRVEERERRPSASVVVVVLHVLYARK